MLRHLKACVSAVAILAASPAIADLVIDIPDVPEFTLSDPIISTEDVVINALPGTTLIIDTRIEAPNITIQAGQVDLRSAAFASDGTVRINADGGITLDDLVPIDDLDLMAGGGISITGGGGGNVPVQVTPPPSSGDITLTASSGLNIDDLIITTTPVDASGAPIDLSNVTATGTSITLTSASGATLGTTTVSGSSTVTAASVTDTETPVAVIETTTGNVSIALAASGFEPLETDLGGGSQASGLFRADAFTSKLFSCPQSSADDRFDEGTCAYAIGGIDRLEADSGAGDFDDTTFAFTLGAQTELTDNVFLGGALGYESSRTDSAPIASETDRGRAGIVLKYDNGSFSAGLALAAAYGAIDTTRALTGATVEGATHAVSYDARLRAAYGLAFGELAVEPALAVSVLHQRQDGYSETGSALAARRIDGIDTTTLGVHPSLTFGTDFVAGPFDTRIRPELTLGLDWYSDPDVTLTGTGATGRPLFQTVSPDQLTGTVAAGLIVFAADDVSLRFRYQGRFGDNTTGHGGQAKLTLGF